MSTNSSLRPTGVPGLDTLLGGGLARDALAFLVGPPGAGKTVLGSQILFNAARGGANGMILTGFTEGNVKLLEHLRPFDFFDEQLVGGDITLLSLPALIESDLDTAAATVVRTARQAGARFVLIDGFQSVRTMFPTPELARRMLALLASQLTYLDITLLVTIEEPPRSPTLTPDLAVADVVIGLDYQLESWRHVRRLEIVKQRGHNPVGGAHSYTINHQGLVVYPRFEALPRRAEAPVVDGPAAFGLPELDALLGGGLTARTATILAGAPGAGKTTLALHWALASGTGDQENAEAGSSSAIFLTFREYPEQLLQKANLIGLDLEPALASGALKVLRMSPVELVPDRVTALLLEALAGGGTQRIVIDDLSPLVRELGTRAPDFLAAMVESFYLMGLSSLFLLDIPPFEGFRLDLVSSPVLLVADNVIILQQQAMAGTLHRLLAVLKMRFSSHDRTLREVIFEADGIRVLAPGESEPGVLQIGAEDGGGFAPTE